MSNANANLINTIPSALVSRGLMTTAFEIVEKVIPGRASFPILSNARLQGDGERLFVTGTDCDVEIVVAIDAAADSGLDITIPAKAMKTFLKSAPKAEYVALEQSDGFVKADFEKVSYNLQALPSSDFPELSAPGENASRFIMAGSDLLNGIEGVQGAMSTEETRYYLNGLLLTLEPVGKNKKRLRMIATDGHRLYAQNLDMPDGLQALPVSGSAIEGVILPRFAMKHLASLIGGKKCPETVAVAIDDMKARFAWDIDGVSITFTTKLVDGSFPDYRRVIPSSDLKPATFYRDELAEGVKACSLVASEKGRAFKLSIAKDGGQIDVNNPDSGSATAQVSCAWESDDLEIGFNARYMLEILDIAGDGELTIEFVDSGSPALISGNRPGWQAVLMPMRI